MIYAVGDIHGRKRLLSALLNSLQMEGLCESDMLLFIGDYSDRGEDSRGVIEMLLEIQRKWPNSVFLRGNHEQLMIDSRDGPVPERSPIPGLILHSDTTLNWLQNGGVETLMSYGVENFLEWFNFIPESHWKFMEATLSDYVTQRYHFVHAGLLPPGELWEGSGTGYDPRLWIREPFLSSSYDFGKMVIFGHTPQRSGWPLSLPNKIGIDTGAAYDGPLTAIVLTEDGSEPPRFIQSYPD